MSKINLLHNPTPVSGMQFDDLYDEISDRLDRKIDRFMRRHNKLIEE